MLLENQLMSSKCHGCDVHQVFARQDGYRPKPPAWQCFALIMSIFAKRQKKTTNVNQNAHNQNQIASISVGVCCFFSHRVCSKSLYKFFAHE